MLENFIFRENGKKNTLKEEIFAGRNFRVFAVFCQIRENLFREIFENPSSAKIYSREICKILIKNLKLPKTCLFIRNNDDIRQLLYTMTSGTHWKSIKIEKTYKKR